MRAIRSLTVGALFSLGLWASGSDQLQAALEQARSSDCRSALPALLQKQSDAESERAAHLAAAKCYSSVGEASKALQILEQMAQSHPGDEDITYLEARVSMRAFNEATLSMFQKTPGSYRVHQLSAEILEIQGRYSDAAGEYRKAIEIKPEAPDLHFRLGRALLLETHDPKALNAAKSQFEAELMITPGDSASEFQLGQISQVENDMKSAETHFERAIHSSAKFVLARVALGRLYLHQKQPERAVPLLKEAITLQPENEAAHYALMTAYRDTGQEAQARAEKATLDKLQQPPDGEFSHFLKKLNEKQPEQ